MKVAHIIAQFLAENGIKRVYTVSGGGCLHIIDSICRRDDIRIVCNQNEQCSSFAADAEARLVGIGCALATSGPGATNLITGIAASYYDSVPVLFLTGNQTRARLGDGLGVRQFGFQSMPIVEVCKTITKYAVIVMHEQDILYELEKALWIAKTGRQGPVLVDVPDDIQRADVDPETLRHWPSPVPLPMGVDIEETLALLAAAKRPVIALGWGVHLAGARKEARPMLRRLGVPCVTTWGAHDIVSMQPMHVGSFGTHGVRAANFAVQNADLVIAIGTRLDTKATGSPASSFAPKAKLVMVDIDAMELSKMAKIGRPCITVQADAREFMAALNADGYRPEWNDQVMRWKADYPAVLPSYGPESPYRIMEELSKYITPDDVIVSDTGCCLAWAMQALSFKCRFIHAMNQTPMGYGLPAAVGAAFATGKRVILLTGDGGLGVNITEFATIRKHSLSVKVVLFNNRSHQMCMQSQRQWLDGAFHGTSEKDIATPDFHAIALAYGLEESFNLETLFSLPDGPAFLEISLGNHGVSPQARFGFPIEDQEPTLPREELARIMA